MARLYGFQLGILPERKMNWRALAASYGFLVFSADCDGQHRLDLAGQLEHQAAIPRHRTDPHAEPAPKPLKVKTPAAHLEGQVIAQSAGF